MDDHGTTLYSTMYPFACWTCTFDASITQANMESRICYPWFVLRLVLEHKDAKEWAQMVAVLCEPITKGRYSNGSNVFSCPILQSKSCKMGELSCKSCHCLGIFLTSNPLRRSFIRLITCGIGVRRAQIGDIVDKSESKLEQTDGQGIGFSIWIIRFARTGQCSSKHVNR